MNMLLTGFDPLELDTQTRGPRRDSAALGRARLVLARLLKREELEVRDGVMHIDVESLNTYFTDRALEDGVAFWHCDREITLEGLDPEDFDALLPFADHEGKQPITLHYARGATRCDVRKPGASAGDPDGYRAINMHINEHLTVSVLSLTLDPANRTALVHVQGEGEYATA